MKKKIVALIIAPIVGAILGYLLADAGNNGWLSSRWQIIQTPPDRVQQLMAINKDSLWVQVESGALYYNESSSTCNFDCWQEVSEIPSMPIFEPDEFMVKSDSCVPLPPLTKVTATISECHKEIWVDRNYSFVLRSDGTIHLWQADIYKEWAAANLFIGASSGAIVFFIFTLIVMLLLSLVTWLSRRAKNAY